jgi:Spy/CpxP family protein refolding chaperone
MKRVLIVGIVTAFALPVLAQQGQHVTISTDGKTITSFGGRGTQGGTASLLSSAQTGSRLLYGGVPQVYKVLGLTDEQTKAIEAVCKEAQTEYRQTMSEGHEKASADDYKKIAIARAEKQAELAKKYELRIADVLTAEQKAQLSKIKALAEQKSAEDKKIAETATAAYKEVLETYKKKLYAILPPEQAKKIEDEDKAPKDNAGAGGAFQLMTR